MKIMPCGYKRTGKLKEHLNHYRQCQHPACKDRLHAWNMMRQQFAKEAIIKIQK
jgi:hypothetical protein